MKPRREIEMLGNWKIMRRLLAALAAAVLAATAFVAVWAMPSSATTTPRPEKVCGTWQARGATGQYPAIVFGGKPRGTEIGRTTAKLTKPAEGVMPGVEFAARTLDVTVAAGTKVTVEYDLSQAASHAAGAVRLFGYTKTNADTVKDGPDWSAVAAAGAGTLSFTVAEAGKIGTLGLVYDASNDAKGSVTFSNLRIGERPVWFRACASASPSASASSSASASASVSASASASASPSRTVPASSSPATPATADPTDVGTPSLPVTGPTAGVVAGVAGAAVLLGAVLLVATRRRKARFEA